MNSSKGCQRFLERALLVVALLGLGWYGLGLLESSRYQASQQRAFDETVSLRVPGPDRTSEEGVPIGSVLGRLEIPRLDLSVIVREGEDPQTLRVAVGHLPGTAWPGRPGNAAIAGHRDTFFRKLRHIKEDDEIVVTTSNHVARYIVVSTRVVPPDDVSVLDDTGLSVLTLVTCYPFFHVGPAPERFIVRALLSDDRTS
jgi:sortase A